MDVSFNLAVGISAAVAIIYTLMGGLYSVAYTDVIQLSFVLFGLVRALHFIESYDLHTSIALLYENTTFRD